MTASRSPGLKKIVSGGQTGVDRAALDVAMELGIPCGGWCPADRRAEDGPIAPQYPLTETPSEDYAQRTEWNVRDSEGTLILNRGVLDGGTAMTVECAARYRKPCLVIELDRHADASSVQAWLREHGIRVVNVAGPRESKSPGIYLLAVPLLRDALAPYAPPCSR